ncbi:hypothetical protein ACQP2P_37210 [Dactylosporangium sp. CA-139114]|uniref:hypothetical protein n=1 Tax=Dactylosporangium sp. CA-139114 TaxID=3239931 RepID=UPI003D971842
MSDFETGDTGADYGHYEAGQESGEIDQLQQAQGSETDAQSQFGVYEEGHHDAESTNFSQGHHTEYDAPAAVHYESDDYTNYSHNATSDDHVFAAEGAQSSHEAQFSELNALQEKFEAAFAEGTEVHQQGVEGASTAELGASEN